MYLAKVVDKNDCVIYDHKTVSFEAADMWLREQFAEYILYGYCSGSYNSDDSTFTVGPSESVERFGSVVNR